MPWAAACRVNRIARSCKFTRLRMPSLTPALRSELNKAGTPKASTVMMSSIVTSNSIRVKAERVGVMGRRRFGMGATGQRVWAEKTARPR